MEYLLDGLKIFHQFLINGTFSETHPGDTKELIDLGRL